MQLHDAEQKNKNLSSILGQSVFDGLPSFGGKMTLNFYVEYLLETDLFQRTRDLFKSLCSLDLEILNIYGEQKDRKPLRSAVIAKTIDSINPTATQMAQEPSWRIRVDNSFVTKVLDSRKPLVYVSLDGYRRILVPIVCRDEVVALLFSGETDRNQVSAGKMDVISDFLVGFAGNISRNELKTLRNYKGSPLTYQEKMITKVKQYIDDNYYKPNLTLTKISSMYGVNYHHLSRVFKQELNTTFSKYVNNLRVDVASRLLKDKSLSVSQISYSCGFDDPGYFCKVFKKSLGTTPAEYRTAGAKAKSTVHAKRFDVD